MKFVRESTGLVKEFGTFDVFALNFSFLGPAAGIAYPLFISAFLPNSNWILAVIISSLLMLPLTINYYILSTNIPRSAGDYIYVSRALGPRIGIMVGMSLITAFSMGFPVLAMLEVIMVIIPALQLIGYYLNNNSIISLANVIMNSNVYLFALTTVFIIVSFLLSFKGKVYAKSVSYLTILQLIGGIISLIGLFMMKGKSITDITVPQLNGQTFALASVFALSLFAFSNAPSFFAGEVKRKRNIFFIGYILSYAIATLFTLLFVLAIEYGIGKDEYITYTLQGWNLPIYTGSTLSFLALPFLKSPLLFLVIASGLTWYLLYAMINVSASSRLLFSMSFDRVLPAFLSEVRNGIPVNALLLTLLSSTLFNFIEVYLGLSVSFAIDGLWFLTWNYLVVSIASLKLANLDRRLLITAPLSILGLSTVIISTIFYVLTYPTFENVILQGNVPFDIFTVILPPLIGLITYEVSRIERKKEGIELELIYKEIQPE
jgi:amino acid transporter